MRTRYLALHAQCLIFALALGAGGITLRAQVPAAPLTLEQVLQLAEEKSESIAVATAGIRRAEGEQARARSGLYPQLDLSAGYDRALASEFSGLFSGSGTTCPQFNPMPGSTIESRVAEIERAIDCGAVGGGLLGGGGQASDSGDDAEVLPFGRKNTWRFNLTFSQNLFSGGRIGAQQELAAVGHESADLALTAARGQLLFQTTQAYYDAALSDRLVTIAIENVRQAEVTLRQAQVRFDAGTVPEFEVLRARVGRDNLTPQVIRQRANRQIAYLRLKQLLDLPGDADLQLAVSLDEAEAPPAAFAPRLASAEISVTRALAADAPEQQQLGDVSDVPRVAVREADAERRSREAALRLTTAQRRPSLSVNSAFGRVAYPSGFFPSWSDQRTNWTIGAAVQWPVLTGGRQRADEAISRAELEQSQIQLRQTDELATLDARSAWAELVAARATWNASAGTVEEATRAYQIAEARYNAGVSTQLELSDSRLLLSQAQANRAQAAHDLQVARARIALLPELPLGTVAAPGGGGSQQTPSRQSAPATPASGASQFTNTSTSQSGGNR